MSIPEEIRREAYYESREDAPTRRKIIYQELRESGPMTAETLMAVMGYMNPNSVRPRLTELKEQGLVRAVGKAHNRAGKNVTLWEAIPPEDIKSAAPGGNDTESGKRKIDPANTVTSKETAVNANP